MARKRKAAKKANKTSLARTRVLRKRLTSLIANANKAQAAARKSAAHQIKVLQARQAVARKALAKLGRQGAAASGPILGGLQKAWRELDVAVRAGAKRFRETS
jgi:ribosomal protein L17